MDEKNKCEQWSRAYFTFSDPCSSEVVWLLWREVTWRSGLSMLLQKRLPVTQSTARDVTESSLRDRDRVYFLELKLHQGATIFTGELLAWKWSWIRVTNCHEPPENVYCHETQHLRLILSTVIVNVTILFYSWGASKIKMSDKKPENMQKLNYLALKWHFLPGLKTLPFPLKSWSCLPSAVGFVLRVSVPVSTWCCPVAAHPQILVLHQPHTEKASGWTRPVQRPQLPREGLKLGHLAFFSEPHHHDA